MGKFAFVSILVLFLGLQTSGAAELPLSTGLPEVLPLDIVAQEKMVYFNQAVETFHAPIAVSILFNNQPVQSADIATQYLVFAEYFFARLPQGNPIRISENSSHQQVWDYPVGSQIIHLIAFKTQPLQIFEVRLEQKLASGKWAFGLYTPNSGVLQLNHYQGLKAETYSLKLANGVVVSVALKHLNLESCRSCHFMNSPSAYQYPSRDFAGPCGFGPANQGLSTTWGARYFKIHGEVPFRSVR